MQASLSRPPITFCGDRVAIIQTYSKVRDSNASRQCDLETARATCPAFGHLYARHAKLVVSINNDGCADHTHKAMKMMVQLYHTASEGLQDMLKPQPCGRSLCPLQKGTSTPPPTSREAVSYLWSSAALL